MPPQSSIAEHMAKFKEMYPEDWDSLVYRYKEHERHTPAGQPHLMREPTQHLLNIVQQFPEACKSQHSSGIPPCLFVNRHAKM